MVEERDQECVKLRKLAAKENLRNEVLRQRIKERTWDTMEIQSTGCKSLNTEKINNDKVLQFVIYAFWNVPPSTQLVSLFVVMGYYLKEMTILQFWSNIISSITMAVFYIIYFACIN